MKLLKEPAIWLLLIVVYILLMILTGCAPYAEYQHLSHPRVSNDGFDLVCGGGQKEISGLMLHAGVCKDVTGYRNEYVRFGASYVWDGK